MSDNNETPNDIDETLDECETCVPKDAEKVIRDHEEQLNSVLADVESPDEDAEPIKLDIPGLDLARRDFMKAGMAVGAASALAGCASLQGGQETTPGGSQGGHKGTVAPGEHDDYYGFWSGGQSGDIRVLGIPSMRELTRIPIFQSDSGKGWGHDDHTAKVMGDGVSDPAVPSWRSSQDVPLSSGDTHHPVLSETDGEYDGKYVWINDKHHGRIARANLKYFETDAIVDVPNVQAVHAMAVQSPDTKYVYGGCEFRTPWPNDGTADPTNPGEYRAAMTALNPETMEVEFQVLVSGNLDNADSSKDGRWCLMTGYNDEEAFEIEGMSRNDRDYVKAFDIEAIEAALEAGNYEEVNGVPVFDARKDQGIAKHPDSDASTTPLVYYIPVPKSPHGLDVEPQGRYAIANGKLSPTVSLIELAQIDQVDNMADAVVGQPKVGLGPLHTTWDDRGHGYTTLFIDSQVAKWDIEQAVNSPKGSEAAIVGKINVHYNPGHIQATRAETKSPTGEWLVSLNKLSKDRFLPVGPTHPDNDQLIYIGEDKDNEQGGMELVHDGPVYPEPHDAVLAGADDINPATVWDQADYTSEDTDFPYQVNAGVKEYVTEENSRVERIDDTHVEVYTSAKRSEYGLRDFTVKEGDEVKLTVTNIEGSRDITHGVAIPRYDINLGVSPKDTRVVTFTAEEPGVYWIYCTWFCSALHLEMRSRMIVEPRE
ncbi:TAT-dependent nitrous-oxide reductase [Halobacteriaceae archaeon GCM10025711]